MKPSEKIDEIYVSMKKECKNCDYKNYKRKGRGYLVCPICGRDITLELVLMAQAKEKINLTNKR